MAKFHLEANGQTHSRFTRGIFIGADHPKEGGRGDTRGSRIYKTKSKNTVSALYGHQIHTHAPFLHKQSVVQLLQIRSVCDRKHLDNTEEVFLTGRTPFSFLLQPTALKALTDKLVGWLSKV